MQHKIIQSERALIHLLNQSATTKELSLDLAALQGWTVITRQRDLLQQIEQLTLVNAEKFKEELVLGFILDDFPALVHLTIQDPDQNMEALMELVDGLELASLRTRKQGRKFKGILVSSQ